MSGPQPTPDVARFPPASHFEPLPQGQRHQQAPWSSESLRDMMNWDAKPDALVFGPAYYLSGNPAQLPPVTEEQLRRSLSASTGHSLSPEPSPTALPGASLDLSAAFPTGQDVPFPLQSTGTQGYVNGDVMAQQSLFINTSPLQNFSSADQYPFPGYVADAGLISPTAESLPRSSISSVSLSMEPMTEALLPTPQGPGFVNPFGGESPTMITPTQHASQRSESSPECGDLSHLSAAQRSGGRQLGSHLDPEKRRDANTMREVGACWSCALQRDKVRKIGPQLL